MWQVNWISIHVPAWGTTSQNSHAPLFHLFQSTFPRGERRYLAQSSRSGKEFQSTFPRGERRSCHFFSSLLTISIHVPAWGTTFKRCISAGFLIFQSTFPRGERRLCIAHTLILTLFQSTFPRGERQRWFNMIFKKQAISIHVPAWGTTANFNNFSLIYLYK